MQRLHVPQLDQLGSGLGDTGAGIRMGLAAGGTGLRMGDACVATGADLPEAALTGILVNERGLRFINEDACPGVLGNAIAFAQRGRAWLICDHESSVLLAQQGHYPLAGESATLGDLAARLGFPEGVLQESVAYYNRQAGSGRDPVFGKQARYLRALTGRPYRVWNLSISVNAARTPAYTLGGLHTDIDGAVLNAYGEPVPGLFAVGRTAAGLPLSPCIAEGLSLADATFFGRRAGMAAAKKG